MQNVHCKIKNCGLGVFILQFAFCILHFLCFSAAADERDDFQAVAVVEDCFGVAGARDDILIELHCHVRLCDTQLA